MAELFGILKRQSGGSRADKLVEPTELRALHRFLDHECVTQDGVIEANRNHTLCQIAASPDTVLITHDGTQFDYTSHIIGGRFFAHLVYLSG
jgi:hypothetical protein